MVSFAAEYNSNIILDKHKQNFINLFFYYKHASVNFFLWITRTLKNHVPIVEEKETFDLNKFNYLEISIWII